MEVRECALVTGASSGLGSAFARLLAGNGYDLVLSARRRERLEELRGEILRAPGRAVRIEIIEVDLSQQDAAAQIAGRVSELGLSIGVLVNNAGVGGFGRFGEAEPGADDRMIAVNVAAATALLHCFLPSMVARGRGRVINVASVAAFQPGPLMAVYYATKAYLLSLSEALAEELSGTGVTVTALCPGPTRTEFHERASIPVGRTADPARVAHYGYRAMMSGRRVAVPGLSFRILLLFSRFLPRRASAAFVHRAQRTRMRRVAASERE